VSQDYVEVWQPNSVASIFPLQEKVVEIGRLSTNQIELDHPTVSRRHAVLECYTSGWNIRDLDSTGGTKVNGRRLVTEHALIAGDEIRIGPVRLVFRSGSAENAAKTLTADDEPPKVTAREHDVLVALCRPLMTSQSFAQPATIKEMAEELFVGATAIKFHLGHLFEKFGIPESGHSRRAQLANEAIRRNSVTMAELLAKELPS
jgi:pSer/pThr/pTyr-binding forkhead associated (FHA) protein